VPAYLNARKNSRSAGYFRGARKPHIFGRRAAHPRPEELYSLTKTKRYSHARIRRVIAALLLGIEAPDCEGIPPYIRVLGFNAIGREKLRAMRSTAKLPIVMRAADIKKMNDRAKHIPLSRSAPPTCFPSPCPQ